MSVQFITDEVTGSRNFVPFCEVCGRYASFGYGVQLRLFMTLNKQELAGKWYCAAHRPERKDGKTS
ncbi:hypothetical protein IWQ49_006396 [Labrenzia sp. EL_126]|nr:hypothetical protein [Labrenzia sp. EL_126]